MSIEFNKPLPETNGDDYSTASRCSANERSSSDPLHDATSISSMLDQLIIGSPQSGPPGSLHAVASEVSQFLQSGNYSAALKKLLQNIKFASDWSDEEKEELGTITRSSCLELSHLLSKARKNGSDMEKMSLMILIIIVQNVINNSATPRDTLDRISVNGLIEAVDERISVRDWIATVQMATDPLFQYSCYSRISAIERTVIESRIHLWLVDGITHQLYADHHADLPKYFNDLKWACEILQHAFPLSICEIGEIMSFLRQEATRGRTGVFLPDAYEGSIAHACEILVHNAQSILGRMKMVSNQVESYHFDDYDLRGTVHQFLTLHMKLHPFLNNLFSVPEDEHIPLTDFECIINLLAKPVSKLINDFVPMSAN